MKSGLGNKPATTTQNPANYGLVNKPAINKPAPMPSNRVDPKVRYQQMKSSQTPKAK
jgi:hypothetical protein